MYRLLFMKTDEDNGLWYRDVRRYITRDNAIVEADTNNRQEDLQGRYFVVSEQEYQEYWRSVVT